MLRKVLLYGRTEKGKVACSVTFARSAIAYKLLSEDLLFETIWTAWYAYKIFEIADCACDG